ncbi:MAG: tyrosine-type recombinase/integrase [Deltaproteobacteria bacterium]|nr:tyrosine-type recombinase/integrase [Deltaproteobacteria bacterium]
MKHRLPKRMRDYLREQGACCKPSTIVGYRLTLGCFYDHLKTTRNPIASLTKAHLQDYLLHLCERKLAPYTKVNYLLAVKKYLQWEVDRGKLPEDILTVLDRSKLPPVPEYLPKPLSSENDQRLQKILRESDSPYAPLFLLLRCTGMRISELINLPRDCVFTNGNEKYLKVPLGKMNTERLVPLTAGTLELIEKIKISQQGLDPNRLIGKKGSVPHVYSRLSGHFKKFLGDITDQNKPITFHRLRHTYATTLLTGGVSLVSLMKLLGHRRIEMTLRYAKVTPSHLRDEYLKAVRILETQSSLVKTKTSEGPSSSAHPAEIVQQMSAFLIKASDFTAPQRHNLLRRLRRLQQDLASIHFSQKFKLHFTEDQCVVGLAS